MTRRAFTVDDYMLRRNKPAPKEGSRQAAVCHQLVDVGRSLDAFQFEDGGRYPSRTAEEAVRDAWTAYYADDLARAEHLGKVVAFLVAREVPKFKANPQRWIDTWKELRT